jgi:serine/threonine protein kinase
MEFCDQGDLNDVLKKHKEVSLEDAERWLYSILEGLAYIHGEGIIHRDLKPGNVLMTGDPPKAKLGDFGLARESTATLKSVAGTVAYMAPEVFHGKYDTPVDMWSLGAMMIEVSARVKLSQPFTNVDEVRASLAKIPARFGDEFIGKIFGMLSMDAEARPTAAELLRGTESHDSGPIHRSANRRKSSAPPPLNFIAETMGFGIDFEPSQSGSHVEVSEVVDHGTLWAKIEKSGGTNAQLRQSYSMRSALMFRTMQRMLQFTTKSYEIREQWDGPAGMKVSPNSAEPPGAPQ